MTIKPRGKRPVRLPGCILAYGLILAALTVLNRFGADRWWLGAFNLYLPQAAWLVPVILLAMLSLGFAGRSVRVMTCNIKNGQRNIPALIGDLVQYKPDVVFLQDVLKVMDGPLGIFFQGWNIRSSDQYVIASRLPLGKAEIRWMSFPGAQEPCLRAELLLGQVPVTLYNVHFLSPRGGLNAVKAARNQPSHLMEAIPELQDNVEHRFAQARAVSEFVRRERGAVIVAGDLNSPDESLMGRALKGAGLHDAFTEGGKGYGYTYGHFLLRGRIPWLAGLSWMRIDHILSSSPLQSRRCWTGTSKASDHRPVFADLIVATP